MSLQFCKRKVHVVASKHEGAASVSIAASGKGNMHLYGREGGDRRLLVRKASRRRTPSCPIEISPWSDGGIAARDSSIQRIQTK